MRAPSPHEEDSAASGRMIALGLAIALVGAGSMMLFVVGVSELYVGAQTRGLLELCGFAVGMTVFFVTYGRYLDRLERRCAPGSTGANAAPATRPKPAARPDQEDVPGGGARAPEPLPTHVVVAVATAGNGLLMLAGSLVLTGGRALVLNVLAAGGLIAGALIVWVFGRGSDAATLPTDSDLGAKRS